MKGAGVSAAFSGMHEWKEATNEHSGESNRCVRLWFPSTRAARRSRALNPVPALTAFMNLRG